MRNGNIGSFLASVSTDSHKLGIEIGLFIPDR